MTESAEVIVVGAGFAGITAARELARQGRTVLVLEARDRVGGRAMAGTVAGVPVDLGGQWIGADHDLFRGLADELGRSLYPQYTDGESILEVAGSRDHVGDGLPKLPLAVIVELGIGIHQITSMMEELPVSGPWDAPKARQWDARSLGSWLDAQALTKGARNVGTLLSNAIFCADPAQVSLLYALECFRQGGGVQRMVDVAGGNQQDKVAGGVWAVLADAAREIEGRVRLSTPVTRIEHGDDAVRVTGPGGEFTAEHVVITVPPSVHGRIAFDPPLPPRRRGLRDRMPMGSVIKAFVAYDTPFWRHQGLSGAVASTDSPLGLVFDQTEHADGPGVLVTLIEGDHAVEHGGSATAERRKVVVDELVRFFGEDAAHPIDYVDFDWSYDPWALGGYGCYMPPGVVTSFGPAIREPLGRLHWAGTETATRSIGYFEGAIESGLRAAREIAPDTPR